MLEKKLKSLPEFDLFVDEKTGFSDVLEGILSHVKKQFPEYIPSKDDPLYELACSFAYRELLLRKRMNDIGKTYCLKLAEANMEKLTPFGFKSYYISKAKECFGVKNATVEGFSGGIVQVYIVIDWAKFDGKDEEKPFFPEKIRLEVQATLASESCRMLNDTVKVSLIQEVPLSLKASVTIENGEQVILDILRDKVIDAFQQENIPGMSKSLSWFVARLHIPGVCDVKILEPKKIPLIGVGEILRLDSLELVRGF